MKRAFTLIELLVVIAIIAILAALLFPVFARAKASAKQTTCLSNLKQIGAAVTMYLSDYDGVYPFAVDGCDRGASQIWDGMPEWKSQIASMPYLSDALQPYVKSHEVFRCPSDTGSQMLDYHYPIPFPAAPSIFAVYGSSYFYRTELAFLHASDTRLQTPADINMVVDAAGHWHSGERPTQPSDSIAVAGALLNKYRYNVLFADTHAKSRDYHSLDSAWKTSL